MKIERQDTDNLQALIQVNLTPEDYQEKFQKELEKQSKNVKMKGFRKGKMPQKTMKKMFGKSVLADIVLKEVNQSLNDYLQKNEVRLLGSPLAAEGQKQYNFDPFELESYEFQFEVGLEPQFDLKGVGDGTSYPYFKTDIDDEMVNEEWESRRKRMGEQQEIEDGIGDGDRVYIQSYELDGDQKKEGGHETEVALLVNLVEDKKVKNQLLKSKKGDTIRFQPSTLEKDTQESYVRKHILQITDETIEVGDEFEGEISRVVRVVPAEIDENFYKSFGADVTNEEEAKAKIKSDLEGFYNRQAEAIMYRQVQDQLLEINEFDMPRDFLQKWISSQDQEAAQKENFADEVDRFVKSLRWTLIKRKLQQAGDLSVSHGEVLDHFTEQIRGYMGGQSFGDDSFIVNTARQLMDNQEQVTQASERIIDDKIFQYISDKVEKDEKVVSKKELTEIIEELNK